MKPKTLDEIKDMVALKNYSTNFYNSPMYNFDDKINEIATEYAQEMVKHHLEKAAENVEVVYEFGDYRRRKVNLNTKIELL